jgi:hypothetical protein
VEPTRDLTNIKLTPETLFLLSVNGFGRSYLNNIEAVEFAYPTNNHEWIQNTDVSSNAVYPTSKNVTSCSISPALNNGTKVVPILRTVFCKK